MIKKNDFLKDFIVNWNDIHPFDYWWRIKYGIRFGSREHLESDFISQKIEYLQQNFEKKFIQDFKRREEKEIYLKTGSWLKEREVKLTQQEEDMIFNNLDLSKFNDTK